MKLNRMMMMCAATCFAAAPAFAEPAHTGGHADHAKIEDKAEDKASTPAKFVENAAQGGMYEVESSKLALTMSKDAKTKEFAQKMVDDHTAANNKLKTLAGSKSLMVPSSLDAKHQKMIDELKSAGGDFDAKYMAQQKKAHVMTIALFEAGAKLSDAELAALAKETLPTLKAHDKMIGDGHDHGSHGGHGGGGM